MNRELPKRVLGRTGLNVSVLGYGAMELRGSRIWDGRMIADNQAKTVLSAVFESGINFIDTSNDYGRSEELIGKYLSPHRDSFYIASKCGCVVTRKNDRSDNTEHVWTSENMFRGLHESLQRLRTDYIDIMQLHNPTLKQCEAGKLVEVLADMKQQGKVRWIGCSSTLPDIQTFIEWGVFDVFQIPYSILEREHENILTLAANSGAGVIVRGAVARGEPGFGLGQRVTWDMFSAADLDRWRDANETRTGFALRYLISHPGVSTAIVGTANPEHIRENITAVLKGPLPEPVVSAIRQRLDQVGEKAA